MTLRTLRARLDRLGPPPDESTPASIDDDLARARLLEVGFRQFSLRGPRLTEAEKVELAELEARFPPNHDDPLTDAIEAWKAAASDQY